MCIECVGDQWEPCSAYCESQFKALHEKTEQELQRLRRIQEEDLARIAELEFAIQAAYSLYHSAMKCLESVCPMVSIDKLAEGE